MQRPGPVPSRGAPAPYGHACTNCSKAKCKCIFRGIGVSCERCHRLSKECQSSTPNRKRSARKPTGSRTAHLEEKLDDLVSLLRSQATTKPDDAVLPHTQPTIITPQGLSSDSSPSTSIATYHTGTSITGVTTPATGPSPSSEYDFVIPDHVAEENLNRFRNDRLKFGPLVYIPPTLTASELRRSKPFLWLAIMLNTTKSCAQEQAIGDRLRDIVAQRIVLEHDRNMDLLQGLLVHLVWSHVHKKDKPYLSVWTQILIAVAQDLGLNKAPPGELSSFICVKKFWMNTPKPPTPLERTMEERRMILNVFVFSSMTSQMLRRIDVIRWTPHMESCLRVLTESPEWEGDMILAVQVRCALISEQLSDCEMMLLGQTQPPSYFIKALQAQLEDIKRSLPTVIAQNDTVLLFLHNTDLSIHECSMYAIPTDASASDLHAVEEMHKCLAAVESWLAVFLAIPVSAYLGLTFEVLAQLMHILMALRKMMTLEHPAWDTATLRRKIDLFAILDRFAENFKAVPAAVGIVEDSDKESIWKRADASLKIMAATWRQEIYGTGTSTAEGAGGSAAGSEVIEGNTAAELGTDPTLIMEDVVMMGFGDDPWLSEIFMPWDSVS